MSQYTDALAVWGPVADGASPRHRELLAQYKAQQDAILAGVVDRLRESLERARTETWQNMLRASGQTALLESQPTPPADWNPVDVPAGATFDDLNGSGFDMSRLIGAADDLGFTDYTSRGSYRWERPPRDQVTSPGAFWPLLTDTERAAGRIVLGEIAPGQLQEIESTAPPAAPAPPAPTATGSSSPVGTAPRQSPVSPSAPALPPSSTTGTTPGAPAGGSGGTGITIGRAAPTAGATTDTGPSPDAPPSGPRAGEVSAGTTLSVGKAPAGGAGSGTAPGGAKVAAPASSAGAGEPSPGLEQLVLAAGAFLLLVGLAKQKGDG